MAKCAKLNRAGTHTVVHVSKYEAVVDGNMFTMFTAYGWTQW